MASVPGEQGSITSCRPADPIDDVDRMGVIFLDNLARLVGGRPLRNRVVPARGY